MRCGVTLRCPHHLLFGADVAVISWRCGRIDRVWRSATCAETHKSNGGPRGRAVRTALPVVRTDGEHSLRPHVRWKRQGLVRVACVTDSERMQDKVQRTVITPLRKERRDDVECLALKGGLEASSNKLFPYTAVLNSEQPDT